MSATVQSNARYVGGALFLHALIVGLIVAASLYSPHIVVPQLGIKATLVDGSSLNPKPKVDPKEQERIEQEKLDRQKQEQERLEQQRQQEKEQQLRTEQQEKEKQAEQKRVAEAQEAKRQADAKRVEEIKQKQREVEQRLHAQSEAKAQAAREADLKAQMAEEEGRNQAMSSGALAQWQEQVKAKMYMKWKVPLSATSSTDCDVSVVQSPNGNVISAHVTRCNGDVAVKESIETAVLDASPLPLPSDMRVFMRSFTLRFHPTE